MVYKPNTPPKQRQRTGITWECRQGRVVMFSLGFAWTTTHPSQKTYHCIWVPWFGSWQGGLVGKMRTETTRRFTTLLNPSRPQTPIFPSKSLLAWPCCIPRAEFWSYHLITSESLPLQKSDQTPNGCITGVEASTWKSGALVRRLGMHERGPLFPASI